MRMLRRFPIVPFLFVAAVNGAATIPLLTPEEALRSALEHNYGIIIADNNAQIARLNSAPGNAGMLPYASIVATDNLSITEPPPGNSRPESAGRQANSLNIAARIDWTLFDGRRMFIARNRLAQLDSIGVLRYRATVLQTHADVLAAYYGIVRQKQQLAFINEVLALNKERVAIAQTSYNAGLVPKTAPLQATIDFNEYRGNVIQQQNAINASKRSLNVLLCRNDETPFDVIDTIALLPAPDRAVVRSAIDSSNIAMKVLRHQVDIAELGLRESRALLLPKFSVNAGYALSGIAANSGATGLGYGPQLGASLSVPLYMGGNGTRQVRTSALSARSAKQELQQEYDKLTSRVGQLVDDFESQLQVLAIEQENFRLAKENLDISMQRLRLGQSTMIELRMAEESYAASRTRMLTVAYNLKIAETTLRLLMARL